MGGKGEHFNVSKQSIINHFSQHGIISCMKPDTLTTLMKPYKDFLSSKGVSQEYDLSNEDQYKLYVGALRAALMDLNMDDDSGHELSNVLDDIALLEKSYTMLESYIEDYKSKWASLLEATGLNLDNRLSLIVALRIVSNKELKDNVGLLISRAQSLDTSTNRDFVWFGDFVPTDEGELESDNIPEKRPVFSIPDEKVLRSRLAAAKTEIDDGFVKNRYKAECNIHFYPMTEDGEIWLQVEHGGRIVAKESMTASGETKIVEYPPLTRSTIVLDTTRKTLRIKAATQWMYNLYVKTFSKFFCDFEYAFVPGQTYHFKPVYQHGIDRAFRIDEFRTRISKVTIVSIKVDVGADSAGTEIHVLNKKSADVRSIWKNLQKFCNSPIMSITLRVHVRKSSSPITIKIDKEKGLYVGKPAYNALIRSWLRRRGFEKGYTVTDYKSQEGAQAVAANNEHFWPMVLNVLSWGSICKAFLYKTLDNMAPGVGDFLWQFVDKGERSPEYSSKWTDLRGIEWDVVYDENDDSYYGSNDRVALGLEEGPHIEADEVEKLPVNAEALLKSIQQTLFPSTTLNLLDKKEGIYRLGEIREHDVHVFLATGNSWKNAMYRMNTTNASVAILTFVKTPPDQYAELLDKDQLQHAWLHELLEWDIPEERLKVKTAISDYLHPNNDIANQDMGKPLKYWPGVVPEDRSYSNVRITMGYGEVTICYGEQMKKFAFDSLEMFFNRHPKTARYSANAKLLLNLIKLHNERGDDGFLLKELGSSGSLSNLNKALGKFFKIEGDFYEKIPGQKKKGETQRYRLAFARCTNTELAENRP